MEKRSMSIQRIFILRINEMPRLVYIEILKLRITNRSHYNDDWGE